MSKTTAGTRPADVGFHAASWPSSAGAGTLDEAARLTPMLDPAELRGGIVAFLADRTFAVITARDGAGRLWTSPLSGPRGFLEAAGADHAGDPRRLPAGDPLHRLPAGQKAGLVVVEFATRRRVRVNGTLTAAGDGRSPWRSNRATVTARSTSTSASSPRAFPARPAPGDVRRDEAPRQRTPSWSARRTRSSSAPPTRNAARTPPTGAARRDSSASTAAGSGGGTTRATTSSTRSATSRSTPRRRCSSSTSTPAARSTCRARPRSSGRRQAPGEDGRTGRRAVFTLQRLVAGRLLPSRQVAHSPYPRVPVLTD